MERKLASIRKVKEIKPIEGADLIELAIVDGWQCVVKKGEFVPGDVGIYFEIDSFLPIIEEFSFLDKCCKKKMNNIEGYRLKTMKMRGEISQGLILPYQKLERFFKNDDGTQFEIGTDVTELLGIQKYEVPIPAQLAGKTKGGFPSFIRKTDQERIQNLFDKYSREYSDNNEEIVIGLKKAEQDKGQDFSERINELLNEENRTKNPIKHLDFEETLKLDGTSCTFYVANVEKYPIKITDDMKIIENIYFGHCSRNLESKESDITPWKIANESKIREQLLKFALENNRNIAFQGELMGPKIQKNRENFQKTEFFLFEIWDIDQQRYLTKSEKNEILNNYFYNELTDLKHVPIINESVKPFEIFKTIDEILEYAKGPSINHKIREGIVYKSNQLVNGHNISFKVINNDFLLKGGE
jgi:tRNA-binding EMAP/Myf-like protein